MEKLFSTCGEAIPLKNSKENGISTIYPNKTPTMNDEKAKNTNSDEDSEVYLLRTKKKGEEGFEELFSLSAKEKKNCLKLQQKSMS